MTNLFKTFVIFISVCSIIVLSSFTKPSGSHRIKSDFCTTNDSMLFEYSEFTYDSAGRIITETFIDYYFDRISPPKAEPANTYYTEYRHDSVFEGKVHELKFKYKLNAKGYRSYDAEGNTYAYDTNGFYINSGGGSGVETQTIANGDIINNHYMSYDSSIFFITDYTYFPDVDPRDFGFDVTGRRSTHLLKSKLGRGIYGNTLNVYYSYEYDDKHRIIKDIGKGGTRSVIHTYTYFD